jgi:hypothetical protein
MSVQYSYIHVWSPFLIYKLLIDLLQHINTLFNLTKY